VVSLDLHAPNLTAVQAADLMTRAHERCPYSVATRGNVEVTLSVDGLPLEQAAESLLENLGGCWLGSGGMACEPAGHDDDHGPVDIGLVVGGQPFVVADGPAVAGDPGQRPFHHPPAG